MKLEIIVHWKYIGDTPAFGKEYHHLTRRVIAIIYSSEIILFKDIPEDQNFYPCFAETKLIRKR